MPTPFAVTTASNSVFLDTDRTGTAQFTVSNQSGRSVEGRAQLVTDDPEAESWISLRGPAHRAFATAGTEQYTVEIDVPSDAPSGNYTLRLDVVGEERPDEQYVEGPSVTFQVPEAEVEAFPWKIVAAIAAVLLVGGGVLAYVLPNVNPSQEVSVSASFTVDPTAPNVGDEVRLDATASTVTGAGTPAYSWTLSVPEQSGAVLDDPQAVTTSFTPDLPGTYELELEVSADGASASRAVVIDAAREEIALEEECRPVRPEEIGIATVRDHRGGQTEIRWGLRGGGIRMDFDNENEAQRSLRIIRHYNLNRRCVVGRPPSLEYWLLDERAPQGAFPGEDCLAFDPDNLGLRPTGDRWVLTDGRRPSMLSFPNEEEGRLALQILEKYQFTHTCYVGRPDPSFAYLRGE